MTQRQTNFLNCFLNDPETKGNGTQSAIKAGYSPHTSNEQAARLLAKASIQDIIKRHNEEEKIKAKSSLHQAIIDAYKVVQEAKTVDEKVKSMRLLNELRDYFPKKIDNTVNIDIAGIVKEVLNQHTLESTLPSNMEVPNSI